MDEKHTPGPWKMSEPPYDSVPWLHVYGPADRNGSALHIMHKDRSDEEKIANARLIAAAPELLSALEALLEGRPTKEPPKDAVMAHRNWTLFEKGRAAIAKARLESLSS